MTEQAKSNRTRSRVLLVMSILILTPSMIGFVMKFVEFIRVFQGETDGAFAITPMLNYLFASLGFFCMLVWAAINGMFHDLERPKHFMLEVEQRLDQQSEVSQPDP